MAIKEYHACGAPNSRPNRAVLCVPNVPRCPDNSNRLYTLALLYLKNAAGLAGWNCGLIDAFFDDLSTEETARRILSGPAPSLVGFSLFSPGMWEEAILVLERLKTETGSLPRVVIGGHYATFRWRELMGRHPQIGFAVEGEGEEPFRKLLIALETGSPFDEIPGLKWRTESGAIREGPPPGLAQNLDDLGKIDFSWAGGAVEPDEWSLSTSRGCTGACSFCLSSRHWGKPGSWRGHSPGWIAARMDELARIHGATRINIVDDNFFGSSNPLSRAEALTEALRLRKVHVRFSIMVRADTVCDFPEAFRLLREAGLCQVFLGLESGNDPVLEKMNKGAGAEIGEKAVDILGRLEIGVTIGNIVFHPWMTESTVLADLDFLEKLLRKHPGARFFELNELDVFSPTPLGRAINGGGSRWLCEWRAKDPQIQAALEQWRAVRAGILFPAMRALPPSSGGEVRRAYDFWQIDTLRSLIREFSPDARISRVYASMCAFLLKQGGASVLDAFLAKQRPPAGPIEAPPHAERCFA